MIAMMRHISMFRVLPEHRTPNTIALLEARLKALPESVPTIISCEIGVKPFPMPTETPDGHVTFYDLVQIISFETPEDCAAYPASQGHMDFLTFSEPFMEQVVGIGYPI